MFMTAMFDSIRPNIIFLKLSIEDPLNMRRENFEISALRDQSQRSLQMGCHCMSKNWTKTNFQLLNLSIQYLDLGHTIKSSKLEVSGKRISYQVIP